MRDLAFLAIPALVLSLLLAVWAVWRFTAHAQVKAVNDAQWRTFEHSTNGVTYVTVELITPDGETLDTREVGQVRNDDPDYDDTLLTLRAKAGHRLAIVESQ